MDDNALHHNLGFAPDALSAFGIVDVQSGMYAPPNKPAKDAFPDTTTLRTLIDTGRLYGMNFLQRLCRRPIRIATAVALGFGIQGAERVLFSSALGRPLAIDEPIIFVWNALFTAMPLIALAFQTRQHVAPWLTAFGVSAWLTWWWLQKGIAYQHNPDGSGVDMGGAVMMLLAPFAITAACLWLNQRLASDAANGS